jgi:hypothetical protein
LKVLERTAPVASPTWPCHNEVRRATGARRRYQRVLGLEGFTVLDTIESDDRIDVLIELKAGAGVCPACAGVSTCVHERTDVQIRDIAVHGKPTYSSGQAKAPMRELRVRTSHL